MNPAFRVGGEARGVIHRLVQAAGGHLAERPVIPGEQGGPTTWEPEPLAGIRAAVTLEREARAQCVTFIGYARGDGRSWTQVAERLGVADADAAWRYAVAGSRLADWLGWTCQRCGRYVTDYGPELAPAEAEQGHAEGCTRYAETTAAWETQWKENGDDE